ncbi:hypothetical protein BC351_34435 [Paenibacillus ferrarius]|uniref:Uncharacterized protein n=1 Tax=Paenibacillus ferrarius TaxID=1469647 RepID=A0A1V4HDY4_9BACL|nr:hypothetical protein [Paenibacillus ferrarius]OPH51912.1 hypothetical protein BC351_34435 [Paenibacillus ferrarius]
MNIYGHLNKVTRIFLDLVFEPSNFNPPKIIDELRESWTYIEKYIKNAHPKWTSNWDKTIMNLNPNELAISEDMVKDTRKKIDKLMKERRVKDYFSLYISIVEGLTIYNKSYEESCDVCQGELHYYTDISSKTVVKKCTTCGCLYNGKYGTKIGWGKDISLRPANKSELESEGILG